MRLLCKWFGHTQYSGWWGDGLYGEVVAGAVDGIGRRHFRIRNTCDRCGVRYISARFSLPKKENTDASSD